MRKSLTRSLNLSDMGLFRMTIGVESLVKRGQVIEVPETLVDTGSEFTWIPRAILESLGVGVERARRFIVADGRRIEREIRSTVTQSWWARLGAQRIDISISARQALAAAALCVVGAGVVGVISFTSPGRRSLSCLDVKSLRCGGDRIAERRRRRTIPRLDSPQSLLE